MAEKAVFGSLPRGCLLLVFVMRWSAVLGCLQLDGQNISFPATSLNNLTPFNGFNSAHHGVTPSLQFTCSGQVDSWEAYFNKDGVYSSIKFQVWRLLNTTDVGCTRYHLIGTNSFENRVINSTLRNQFVPTSESVIKFQVGDVVGFYVDFNGTASNNSLQSNPEASIDSYTYISTGLNGVAVDGISTFNNCSLNHTLFFSVPLLTASVTEGTGQPDGGNLTPSRFQPTTKPNKNGLTIPVAGLIVIVLVILFIIGSVVVTAVVIFMCVSPNVLIRRRKGRGRDLTTLTVAVCEVYPQSCAVPIASRSSTAKENLDGTYELPPDSMHYTPPRTSQLSPEYTFMNPRNTLAEQSSGTEKVSTEYDIPRSTVEPGNTLAVMEGDEIGCDNSSVDCPKPLEPEAALTNQQDGNTVKECDKSSISIASLSVADPEHSFMNPLTSVSNANGSACESPPLYEIPLIPMELEYTVMSPPPASFRDKDDEGDYCEVGPLQDEQGDK